MYKNYCKSKSSSLALVKFLDFLQHSFLALYDQQWRFIILPHKIGLNLLYSIKSDIYYFKKMMTALRTVHLSLTRSAFSCPSVYPLTWLRCASRVKQVLTSIVGPFTVLMKSWRRKDQGVSLKGARLLLSGTCWATDSIFCLTSWFVRL